jgi:hypothetical protein
MLLQSSAAGTQQAGAPLAWTQIALVAVLLVAIGAIAFMLVRTGMGSGMLSRDERTWLDYGNLYVVALGIGAVTVGFLVMLLFLNQFPDRGQALILDRDVRGCRGFGRHLLRRQEQRRCEGEYGESGPGHQRREHDSDGYDRSCDGPRGCCNTAGSGCQPHGYRDRD